MFIPVHGVPHLIKVTACHSGNQEWPQAITITTNKIWKYPTPSADVEADHASTSVLQGRAGCFDLSDRLRGSIISAQPIDEMVPVNLKRSYLTVTVIVADWVVFPAASVAITYNVCVVLEMFLVFQFTLNGEEVSVAINWPST
jgi:hypothetical protein